MLLRNESNWLHLFLWGSFAVVLSWATTGCRFGDHVENPPPPPPNPDEISGYYLTQPQTLTLYVTLNTQSATLKTSAPVSLIPSFVGDTMTNPVALVLQDLDSRLAFFATPRGENPLPVLAFPDFSIAGSWSSTPETFWDDPLCQSNLEFTASGSITQNSDLTPPAGFLHTLSGEVKIKFLGITQFQGNCTATFQTMADCYRDATLCGGSTSAMNLRLQNAAVSTFNGLIQSKLITPADIPHIKNYAYEVTYE